MAQEAQTGFPRVSRNLYQPCDQHSAVGLTMMVAGGDSLFVFSNQCSRLFRPLEHTALAHTFVFPHTADFRRPALVESLRSHPPKNLCASEKASSLQTEGHAKLPRNLHVEDSGETRLGESQFDLKWPAYTRFRRLSEIVFSCRKSCRKALGARDWVLQRVWEMRTTRERCQSA